MAQQLWLLRHGDAEDGPDDAARRLTERGERQARAAGAALARMDVGLAAAYTSPRVRAVDMARIACGPLGLEPAIHQPLDGGWDGDGARTLLAGHGDGDAVLAVGHSPDLENVVHDLSGARADVKKGALACVEVESGRATVVALLRPRELELLGG